MGFWDENYPSDGLYWDGMGSWSEEESSISTPFTIWDNNHKGEKLLERYYNEDAHHPDVENYNRMVVWSKR